MPHSARAPSRWPVRIALVLVSLAATFAALEAGFRIRESTQVPDGELWAVYDPELGYRNNPAFGDHNELGLRDHRVLPKDGRFRVLVLGDSVAYYGDDVDDTWVGRLRMRLLEGLGARKVDVVNAATKGYTNFQELRWLETRGLALEPDLVGVAFVLNDCYRILHAFRVVDGRIVGQDYDFSPEALAGVESPLYRLLRQSRFLVWLRRRLGNAVGAAAVESGRFSFEVRPDFAAAWRDEPWRAIEAQLAELRSLGKREGFRAFVVCFPFGDQYREDYLERDAERVLFPQRQLGEICARLEIDFLDLYPMLEPGPDLEADRIHLTAEGRQRVADLVARFLAEHELLPGPD